jgi:hypothetical protein
VEKAPSRIAERGGLSSLLQYLFVQSFGPFRLRNQIRIFRL